MIEPSVSSGEYCELLLDEIDLDLLASEIKGHGRLRELVFSGFRPKGSSLRNPAVRQRLVAEVEAQPALLGMLIQPWQARHQDLMSLISSQTIAALKKQLTELCERFGGANVDLALSLDARRGVRGLGKLMSPDLIRTRACNSEGVEPGAKTEPEASTGRDSSALAEARDRLSHLKKEKRELEHQLKSERGRVAGLQMENRKLKAEAERSRRERDEAKKRADSAEGRIRKVQTELEEAKTRLQEQTETIASLRRALDENTCHGLQGKIGFSDGWQGAVDAMISDGRVSSALDFLLALKELQPDNPQPHVHLERLYEVLGDAEARRRELLWLAAHGLSAGDHRQAALCCCRAIAIGGEVPGPGHIFWQIVKKTGIRDERRKSNLRIALLELRQVDESLHEEILEAVAERSPVLAEELSHAARIAETERHFEIAFNGSRRVLTPRKIVALVDSNQVSEVNWLREALRHMRAHAPETAESLLAAIREVDWSAAIVLQSGRVFPAVVDGSNVAHHYKLEDVKPRLRNLVLIRSELRRRSYFPIHICADDALRHQIDHQSEFLAMIERGEIELADAKTDADSLIVDLAQRLECVMVTNDRMRDWDPDGRIPRLRYSIDGDSVEVWEQPVQ